VLFQYCGVDRYDVGICRHWCVHYGIKGSFDPISVDRNGRITYNDALFQPDGIFFRDVHVRPVPHVQ
jgi:hypothetical protein